ncbi:6-carboxyhexanoate--CoA ligase [Alkalihalobacillus sp. CinArs1]|uniref:6-carboxyhexanoate--CoA ligase n=1 Tax=Alkalihalobacillus sp. CinArs1 TaxID=2995314 RepID=UPI0022DDA67C|nr:6-carboxyhexanoate--CoA ligase [Alkalihalobacillus sp. CinArs1]
MRDKELYSIRMRASEGGAHEDGGKHVSGGEQLSTKNELIDRAASLVRRAFSHQRGEPDFLRLTIEKVSEPVHGLTPLPVSYTQVSNASQGRLVAEDLLKQTGLTEQVIVKAMSVLETCYGVRGAIIIDSSTGDRIDGRHDKGIRVSRLDWNEADYTCWLEHFQMEKNQRLREALPLATKVASHPDSVAEFCFSDDPDYITGYVASKKVGYHRISQMKERGDENGGRLFFVNPQCHVSSYIDYLEKEPILLKGV